MNRLTLVLPTVCLLGARAQIDLFGTGEDEAEIVWPQVDETTFDAIPHGATEHNEEGFALTGSYSTITQQTGEQELEVSLTLWHTQPNYANYVYLVWLQVIDPIRSTPRRDFYEGFSCGLRLRQENQTGQIPKNNIYQYGYLGVRKLEDANNARHDEILQEDREQTEEEYPWYLIYDKTTANPQSASNGKYSTTCTIDRQFQTTYSNVPLKGGEPIYLNLGYKVYYSHTVVVPSFTGYVLDQQWMILDTTQGALAGIAFSALASLSVALAFAF